MLRGRRRRALLALALVACVAAAVSAAPLRKGGKGKAPRATGSTSVVANRNYMSVAQDEEGRPLGPKAVEREKELERLEAERRVREERNAKQNVEEEVREAQREAAAVDNDRTRLDPNKEAEAEEEAADRIELGDGWEAFGGAFGEPEAHIREPYCLLNGVVKGKGHLIARLPEGCRSGGRIMFQVMQGPGPETARLDVLDDGRVYLIGEPPKGDSHWLSLSGIYFTVADGNQPLELESGWKPYGGLWKYPEVRRHAGTVMLSGLLRKGRWDKFAHLPEEFVPERELAFGVCNHKTATRVDVSEAGVLTYAGGTKHHGWVALDGIFFALAQGGEGQQQKGEELELLGAWQNEKGKYRLASVRRVGDVCFVSGALKSKTNSFSHHIATLPTKCRPKHGNRIVFAVNSNGVTLRADVDKNGKVFYVPDGRVRGDNFLSLDGVTFVAEPSK